MDFLKTVKEVSSAASKIGFAVACVAPVVAQLVGKKEEKVPVVRDAYWNGKETVIQTDDHVFWIPPTAPAKKCSMFTPPQVCEDRNCRYHQTSKDRDFSRLR